MKYKMKPKNEDLNFTPSPFEPQMEDLVPNRVMSVKPFISSSFIEPSGGKNDDVLDMNDMDALVPVQRYSSFREVNNMTETQTN